MKKCLRFYSYLLLSVFLCAFGNKAFASHIYGVDLYYTYVSGNTYTVSMVIYGDCSAAIVNSLYTNSPEIQVYNGSALFQTFSLAAAPSSTNGTEITPVCAADINNTACSNATSSIPGVRKFYYSANVTLNAASANWRFHFDGNLLPSNQAGRSGSITNVVNVGSTIISVDATLNNANGSNSSPVYTTIPTPFFCINKPANYNSGAVDPNNDSLSFALVAAQDATTGTAVTYVTPYTPTNPLDVTAGTFLFSATTGQLSFTPDLAQKALVVYTVTEYRNGVVVGTSQREMSFVVLSNCNNNPPSGSVSNPSTSTVTITDSTDIKACQSSGLFTFQINPTDPDGNNVTVTSAGLPAGATFNVVNNGTAAPLGTFSWNPVSATPGVYTFYITYQDDGCPLSSKQTVAYTVTVLPSPTETFALVSPATCAKKAVFTVTPIGTTAPYHIDILQGTTLLQSYPSLSTSPLTDSLIPGTYTFRTYNTNNCYKDTTVTLAAPPAIIPNVTYQIPLCPGGSTGSINLTAGGGLPPFTYAIGAGTYSNTNNFTGLAAGSYILHIKDGNFCQKDTTVNLPDATPILLNVTLTKPPCNHFQNGVITVSAYNSVAPYQYAMGSTGTYSSSGTFSNLYSGTYDIFVKNGNGCIIDSNIVLPDSVKIHATLSLSNILCNSSNTGSIVVNASGAFGPPYTYAINTNAYQNSNIFNNLSAANYTVHVRDPDQCYFDTTVTITQPTPIVIAPTITNVSCHGTATGAILAATSGGVSPYTYSINSGAYSSQNNFTGLTAGTYIVNVRDANNCTKHDTINITEPAALVISNIVTNNVTCNGTSTGSFVVTASGGTTPYSYAVGAGSFGSSNTLGNLAAGTYIIHLKDNNGCTVDSPNNVITQPTAIIPTVQLTNSTCHTLSNGVVTLSATGGTPSYTYSYNNNGYTATPTFSSLAAGTYTFHIKDNNGCIKDTAVTVIDSLVISGIFNITPATCYGISDGAMTITGAGGSNPYNFAMGAGAYSTTNTFSNIAGGVTYTMHIRDNNGCINDTNVLVPQPTLLLPQATFAQPSCYGYSDGSITMNASGGTPAYTFALGSGSYSTTVLYPNLPSGPDTVHIKDANNCQRDTIFTITQPTPLKINNIAISNVKCFGDSSGFVTVTASGATPPYNYGADAGAFQTSNIVGNLNVGSHIIHVKDNNSCALDSTVSLVQPTAVAFVLDSLVNPTCEGYTDGKVILNATGGVSPYLYSMDNVTYSATDTFLQLPEGTYNFFIQDNNNCIHDTTMTLTGYPHIVIENAIINDLGCSNVKDGSIILNVSGGNPPLLYMINNGFVPQVSNVFDSLKAGQYTITITDSTNCHKDTTVTIHQPDSMSVTVTMVPNDCEGYDNTGSVSVNVTGGTPPYTYLWSTNPVNTTSSISGMPNGNYMVWIHDAGQCADTVLTTVNYDDCCKPYVPDAFTPNADGKNDLFRVRFKGDMKLQNLSIYNRFGQRVFNTIYIDQGWDGTYNGVPQPMDTYFYYIKVWCGNKEDHTIEMHGDLTLIR